MKVRTTLQRMSRLLPRAHLEVMKGTPREAAEYCKRTVITSRMEISIQLIIMVVVLVGALTLLPPTPNGVSKDVALR